MTLAFYSVCLNAGEGKRLSPSLCVSKKIRLFAVLDLTFENRDEIALYRSASQFLFFQRCLQSWTSLLSSAMAMGKIAGRPHGGIEQYGNWVCRPKTSLRDTLVSTHEMEKMSASNADRLAQ